MALSISQFMEGPRSLLTSTGRPAKVLLSGASGLIWTRISDDRSALLRLVLLTILPVRVLFLDGGMVIEDSPPEEFFNAPKSPRAKAFLAQIVH